ncbi:extracellular solute-binding protein [Paenibacillus sp. WQ 127069]|uniref:Extracellular solute-binding protein n=1 Tax=Paenibacillus baimaensis TaxID=2982185 RepID=A0ABT2UFD4_9BACL|nr:extracellular solute-binding protein [Paenibacillus sp. WQ 127069]MCU6793355.1 extracellular solute-binding protein [Paenibacillus sp. WQ 127069]
MSGQTSTSRMKNTFVLGLSAVLAAGAVGCSQNEEGAKGQAEGKATITVSNYDRGNIPAVEGTVEENRWTKWINEHSPVTAMYVPVSRAEAVKKLNVLFASGSAPDIVNDYDTGFRNSLYQQKQLMPLDDYLKYAPEYQKLLDKYPQLRKIGTKPDGKLYEIGKINEPHLQSVAFIRMDWLKKLKLEVPKTTDELLVVLKAFVEQDPDGNGKKDTYGTNMSYTSDGMVDSMFGSYGWKISNDDKIIRTWDNTLESLKFKKRLFEEGLIDKDYLADKNGAKAKQDYLNGKIGVYLPPVVSNWFESTVTDLKTLRKVVPEAEIAPMAQPKSPMGQFVHHVVNPVQMTTVINAAAKNPKAAMEYINFIIKPETGMILKKGIEGEHWKKGADGFPKVIDPAKNAKELDWALDYSMFYSIPENPLLISTTAFDVSDPDQKAGLDMLKKADEFLLNPEAQYPALSHYEHMPTLSSELVVINTNVDKEIKDIYAKGIIGGASYTPEQAVADTKAAWERGGGKQIEEFMNTWYKENKDRAFLGKDILELVRSQHK